MDVHVYIHSQGLRGVSDSDGLCKPLTQTLRVPSLSWKGFIRLPLHNVFLAEPVSLSASELGGRMWACDDTFEDLWHRNHLAQLLISAAGQNLQYGSMLLSFLMVSDQPTSTRGKRTSEHLMNQKLLALEACASLDAGRVTSVIWSSVGPSGFIPALQSPLNERRCMQLAKQTVVANGWLWLLAHYSDIL